MATKQNSPFNLQNFLSQIGNGKSSLKAPKKTIIFSQGDLAEAVYYIREGKVTLSVISQEGKEAIVGVPEKGAFFGEGCLAGQRIYMATATTLENASLLRISKTAMIKVLHDEPAFSEFFLAHLLAQNIRIQEDLVDQLFNSSEKRLARMLLLLAHFGKEGKPEAVIPKVSQETLAEMVGTTRSRVSFFMNKFRKLGFIEYDGDSHKGLRVHSSLLNVILHD
jgi:CRP/FNR family transcriptional regulator, cyclic AMP receptor protein